jgi:drug/metabolite transporter (DMT)-like permease
MILGSSCLAIGPWLVRLADVGPISSGFWRLAIASPLLLLLCPLSGQKLPRLSRGLIGLVLVAGIAFALDLAFWHEGIVRTRLANSTLVANATSFTFAAWGYLVARRLPSRGAAFSLLTAFSGLLLLMSQSYELSPEHLKGDILCLVAALFYTVYLIAIGNIRRNLAALPTLALATVAGAAVAFIVASYGEANIWPHDWTPLVILAVTSQVTGQGLLVYAVGHLEPVVAGLCLLVQPVISGTIGWIVYGEKLGPVEFAGALMIAAALVLIRRPNRPVPPAVPIG